MSHVTHEFPRAYEAATKVDPIILAKALDHIARTAARSRSQTRRLRWIEQRALIALRGDEYCDSDLDLPKSAGPDTHEKLQRRMAYHIAIQHQLREALQALHANMLAQDLEDDALRPSEGEFQQCMSNAAAALANVEGGAGMNAATQKRYLVTVELRGPAEVVEREWPEHLVADADDAYLMAHSHLSDAQKDRVVGHNVVEVA